MVTMKHPTPSTGLGKLLSIDSHGLVIANTDGITWLMVLFQQRIYIIKYFFKRIIRKKMYNKCVSQRLTIKNTRLNAPKHL